MPTTPTTPREYILDAADSLDQQAAAMEKSARTLRLNAELLRNAITLADIRHDPDLGSAR